MLFVKAFAKINWALSITGLRDQTYHELDMLMQSVSLCDEMTFEKSDHLSLIVNGSSPDWDDRNLVCKAANALLKYRCEPCGAAITLQKNIPSRAGLGGGSADCAAALYALNRLWALNLSDDTLADIGLTLGADVPFCLKGGLCRVQGIGEKVTPLAAGASPAIILFMPDDGLSTGSVFHAYDDHPLPKPSRMNEAEAALLQGDYALLNHLAFNDLTRPACTLSSAVEAGISCLEAASAMFARMSGSGSCVYGVFRDDQADHALAAVQRDYPSAQLVRTVPCGWCIEER